MILKLAQSASIKIKIKNYKILIYISGILGLSGLPGRISGYPIPAKSKILYPTPPRFPIPSGNGYLIPAGYRVGLGITRYPFRYS